MSIIKHGMVTEDSYSDFDHTKKAAFYDEAGLGIADQDNKDKLKVPKPIKSLDIHSHLSHQENNIAGVPIIKR